MSDKIEAINQLDFSKSDQYILSIRLMADGFSFSIFDTTTKKYYLQEEKTDGSLSLTANIKRLFQELDFLNYSYLQKRVIFTGRRYILLPLELFEDEQRKTIFYHSHIKKENETIRYDIVKENNLVVLYGIDTSAYKHLKQWNKNIIISSQISIFIEQLIDINRTEDKKQMYIDLHKNRIDILSFDQGALLNINSFTIQSSADILYYSLYVWKQLDFDQQTDEYFFLSDSTVIQQAIPELKKYIKTVNIFPYTIPFDFKIESN